MEIRQLERWSELLRSGRSLRWVTTWSFFPKPLLDLPQPLPLGDSPRGENTGHWIPHPKARATQATASCPNGVPLYVPSFATRLAGGYFTLTGASSSLLVLPLPSSSSSSLLIFFFRPRHPVLPLSYVIWFLASFLSLFNRCRNTKAFQDRIKKKWPTKATLASEVQSHLANHVALKTTLHTLDNAFNALISPANPTGWRPNGRLSTLEVDLAALQARHEESKRDFHRFIRAVAKFEREYKAHTARGGDFRKLRATVMQLSRKFVVFVGRSGRVTRLEGEVASLKERLEALENASPSQHPPASTPSSSQPQIPSSG